MVLRAGLVLGLYSIDDAVDKFSCDYNNSSPTSMCLHTGSGGGDRINDILGLNSSTAYEKIFFVSNDVAAVPEPASFALFGLAGAGLIAARRRKRKQAQTSATCLTRAVLAQAFSWK